MKDKKYTIILMIISILLIIIGIVFIIKNKKSSTIPYNVETKTIEYLIKPGDDIETIALKYNISYREILLKNNMQNEELKIGEKLLIPNQTIVLINQMTTFQKLTKNFHIDESKIKYANGIKEKETKLEKNTKIIIPNRIMHVVEKNDTLEKIAQKFNVTTYALKKENNIKKDIKEKDIIIIPNYEDIKSMINGNLTNNNRNNYQTKKDQQNILNLVNIGLKMSKEGTYKLFKKNNSSYYVTYGELKKTNPEAINYVSNCLDNDIIIKFYENKEMPEEPLSGIRYDCILPF